jgi:hypothetical protein
MRPGVEERQEKGTDKPLCTTVFRARLCTSGTASRTATRPSARTGTSTTGKLNLTAEALGIPVVVDLESCQIRNAGSCADKAKGVISVTVPAGFLE